MKVPYIDSLIAAVLGVGKSGSWNSKAKRHRFENLWLQPFCHVWYRNFPNSSWDTWDRKGLRLFAWSCERILTVAKLLCTIVQGGARPAGRKAPHQRGWGKYFYLSERNQHQVCGWFMVILVVHWWWTMSLLNGASPERLKHQKWSNDEQRFTTKNACPMCPAMGTLSCHPGHWPCWVAQRRPGVFDILGSRWKQP